MTVCHTCGHDLSIRQPPFTVGYERMKDGRLLCFVCGTAEHFALPMKRRQAMSGPASDKKGVTSKAGTPRPARGRV
jgi:hypothetical protein